ncbi:MAG TPA: integrase [Verrucomicrobiae bacterium]|nr:integrase [Verrucomicrobiae bacterium]
MSEITRKEVLAKMRRRYVAAGLEYKGKLINQAVELFGYHRKAAIRALRRSESKPGIVAYVRGRPRKYSAEQLLKPLKVIWLAALQPCGKRLVSAMPEWVPAYEQDHHKLDSDVRESLLSASAATLDRLLAPARAQHRRRGATRPGTLLRQEIPIRTEWCEESAGFLEIDTVALCGGSLDDRHAWMFDGVDIQTTWVEMRGLPNRGQAATLSQLQDVEQSLPFALAGLDADNGGEFINHHLVAYAHQRERPLAFTRSRPYRKNDNAHVEQKNYTHVRQWFGYERHDNPAVVSRINALCKGALGQLLNFFLPSMKLQSKRREGSRTVRVYDRAATPVQRVLVRAEVSDEKKAQLRQLHQSLNPFALRRQIDKQLKEIDSIRQLKA